MTPDSLRRSTQPPLTLGIETSCDETGVALYHDEHGLLGHRVYTQQVHQAFGGVVPELASRDHVRKLLPLTQHLLADTGLSLSAVTGVAYTAGPGLIGALLAGAAQAQGLAFALGVPSLGVHHMEGHLLAPLLDAANRPEFPFVALLVSGGHTLLVLVRRFGVYRILGNTLDDAVGEAFDKTAKLLGLGYPGGPALARRALQGRPGTLRFPRPMTDRPGLDFSFSGLKTAAITALANSDGGAQAKSDIAQAFQEAVVDTLAIKCRRALDVVGAKVLVVAGGVGANTRLRERLTALLADELGGKVLYPEPQFCTDNGAMIAYAGHLRLKSGQRAQPPLAIAARARWSLEQLPAIDAD